MGMGQFAVEADRVPVGRAVETALQECIQRPIGKAGLARERLCVLVALRMMNKPQCSKDNYGLFNQFLAWVIGFCFQRIPKEGQFLH